MKHLTKILLSVEPGSLYNKMVDVRADLSVDHVVSVDNIHCEEDHQGLDGASDANSHPGWRNHNCGPDAPNHSEAC